MKKQAYMKPTTWTEKLLLQMLAGSDKLGSINSTGLGEGDGLDIDNITDATTGRSRSYSIWDE